jgi:hypothetical protein
MRLAPLAAAFFLLATPLAAAQSYDTPEALLEAFYQPYLDGDFPEDDSHFRSEALQAHYDRDAEITPEGELGALGFDPYVDGQDYSLTEFHVGTPQIAGEQALVDVTFNNFDEARSLTYELVNEDGWKIDDVVSNNPANPYRLSEIFAETAGE